MHLYSLNIKMLILSVPIAIVDEGIILIVKKKNIWNVLLKNNNNLFLNFNLKSFLYKFSSYLKNINC